MFFIVNFPAQIFEDDRQVELRKSRLQHIALIALKTKHTITACLLVEVLLMLQLSAANSPSGRSDNQHYAPSRLASSSRAAAVSVTTQLCVEALPSPALHRILLLSSPTCSAASSLVRAVLRLFNSAQFEWPQPRSLHTKFGSSKVSRCPAHHVVLRDTRIAIFTVANRQPDRPSSPSPWRTCRSCLPASTAAPTTPSSNSSSSMATASPPFLRLSSLHRPADRSRTTSLPSCRQTHPSRPHPRPNTVPARRRHSSSPPSS